MNNFWWKYRNVMIVAGCVVVVALIYVVNIFHLDYAVTSWKSFGGMSILPTHISYFVADTPNVVGFIDMDTGQRVECAEAVAYVETASGETYRCCQAETKVSCIAGDFSSDVSEADTACNDSMVSTFGVPASLPGVLEYQFYGSCVEGSDSELTVVQMDANGNIQWKTVSLFGPSTTNGALRCVVGPALLAFAGWTIFSSRRKPDPERQMRKW